MPELLLFVSHIREDRVHAAEIVAELERRGIRCWIAPRDVQAGKPFDDEIAEAIDASRAMLLIFSELCNESEYIRREVTVAGEAGKVIIPFRIEDAQPKKGLRVRLSDLHWIDAFKSRERAIDELVRNFLLQTEDRPAGQGERRKAREASSAGAEPQTATEAAALAQAAQERQGQEAEASALPVFRSPLSTCTTAPRARCAPSR